MKFASWIGQLHDRHEAVYGTLCVHQWRYGPVTWVEVQTMGCTRPEQALIRAHAELIKDATALVDELGLLIRLDDLPAALSAAGFVDWSRAVALGISKEKLLGTEQRRQFFVNPGEITAEKILLMHKLLLEGESLNSTADECEISRSMASKLRRGLYSLDQLPPDVAEAWQSTFGANPALREKMPRTPSKLVDARNARDLRALWDCMQRDGLTLSKAVMKLKLNYTVMLRLSKGPNPTMAPQTLLLWKQTFGRAPNAKARNAV